jgi:hypothetical protein
MGYIVNPVTGGGGAFVPLPGTAIGAPLSGTIKITDQINVFRAEDISSLNNVTLYDFSDEQFTINRFGKQTTIKADASNLIRLIGGVGANLQLFSNNRIDISSGVNTTITSNRLGILMNFLTADRADLTFFTSGVNQPTISWGNSGTGRALSFFGSPLQTKQTVPNVPSGNVNHTEFNNLLQVLRDYGLIG